MTETNTTTPKKRPLWLSGVRWALFSVLGVILVFGLIWAGLQTRWAKDRLAAWIGSATAHMDGYRVTLEGLDGLIPFSIQLARITLSDTKGPWLEGHHLDMAIDPASLLAGRIDVTRFRMDDLSIDRVPETGQGPSEEGAVHEDGYLPWLPRAMVREIRIDRLDLGEAIAGPPLSYGLRFSAQTGGQGIDVSGLFQDLERPDDALRLTAAYHLKTRRLTADARYHESAEGLLIGLAGLRDATGMDLRIRVDGPLSHVEARLDLQIGGYGRAGLDVAVNLNEHTTLIVGGVVKAQQGLLPEDVTAALGGSDMDLRCEAALSPDRLLRITSLTAKTPSTTLKVEGHADLDKGLMEISVTADPIDIAPFVQGTDLAYQALGPVHLTAKGPFNRPEVLLETAAGGLQVPDVALKNIALKVHAAFKEDFRGIIHADASLMAGRVSLSQMPDLKGPIQLDVTAGSPDLIRWDISRLDLTAPKMSVQGKDIRIDTANGDVAADMVARLDRAAVLLPPQGLDMDARLTLHAHAEGNAATRQVTGDLNMALAAISGLPPAAAAAVGPELRANVRATLKDDVLTLAEVRMTGERVNVTADGRLALKHNSFDINYHLMIQELSEAARAMALNATGDLEGRGRITGAFGDFNAYAELLSDDLQVNDLDIETLHARLTVGGLPEKPSGSLHLEGVALDQPMRLDAGFSWSGDILGLSRVAGVLPGMDLSADLQIIPEKRRLSGTAEATMTSLTLVRALTGQDVRGSGNIELTAGEAAHDADLTLRADFKDLRYRDLHVAGLGISATVDDMADLRGRISVEATDGTAMDARLDSIKVDAAGSLHSATATLAVKGEIPGTDVEDGRQQDAPVSVSARLRMTREDAWRLGLEAFEGRYREFQVALRHPAAVVVMDREITMDELELEIAGGTVQAKGALAQQTVQASVRVNDLPLTLFEPFVDQDLKGTVSAEVEISGLLRDPEVHVQAHLRDYRIRRGEGRPPILLEAGLKAERRKNRFEANLTLTGLDKDPFIATASLPVRLSLQPFVVDLDKDAAMSGELKGNLDLTVLQGMPVLGDQTVSGLLTLDMGLGGSFAKWELTGGMDIQDGHYENPATGTILSGINGRLQADGRSLRLIRLTATDGETGKIVLEGGARAEIPFAMDADVTFDKATLLRKEVVTSTASGKVDLIGDADRIDLTGEITLDRTEITIPSRLPPDVVVIPVTEINLPPEMSEDRKGPPEDSKRIFMDLSLNIPARFFVRGRGLDAEFKGDLTAEGSANNPVIRGTLQVVRGTFQFLARTFHITHGQIAFDGATPPVPLLNISTRVAAGQIDAQVQVTGPADAFRITLSSQPPLPQDEIMAHILFGQSVAKLNAFQAYQLAASVSQLSGGGMPDIMGRTRSLLGVDRLSFSAGDDSAQSGSGPTISAGKYISEGVYVGVEQELTDAKQDVVVEVDLTPSFSVESKAGTRSGAGIGFNWKYDY